MKTLQLLLAALALLESVSGISAPVTPTSVPLNGWFKCSRSTLDAGTKQKHDDDYYMQTKGHHKSKHHKRHQSHAQHEVQRGDQSARMGLRMPSVLVGEQRRKTLPFLQKQLSVEWMAREQENSALSIAEKTDSTHARQQKKSAKTYLGYERDEEDSPYECAEFRVPMCYEGVCTSNRTIDVFVKRVVAKPLANPSEKKKSLWVLQGGPGASSTAMEGLMDSLYDELEGKVSLYTMDHRGTARSNRLICEAAQAGTTGSPSGTSIGIEEVPACIQDVLFQIDNQTAAFSVTSAAMDLKSVIDNHLSDEDVFVYGLSYGTYLVERLIHFAPKAVKGFSVDGIVSEFGSDEKTRATYSNWDRDVGIVADRFLAHCLADPFCKTKFPGVDDLSAFTRELYKKLDEATKEAPGSNACADALASSGTKPSYFLRTTFGDYLTSERWRTAIPAIIFRANRCSAEDAAALEYLAAPVDDEYDDDVDNLLYTSEMLYNVIVFSEMWEQPSPDKATLIQWYENATMASDNFYTLPYYCLFTGSKEKACAELKNLPQSLPFVYQRDQYWNVPAVLPDSVSALLMVGGLDVQTRRAYGKTEFDDIEGDKMLVNFEYAGHCTTFTTPTKSGEGACGMRVLASFVRENGDVRKVDTSCVNDTYALEFRDSTLQGEDLFGTRSLYN